MLMAFFSWWYGRGWQNVLRSFKTRLSAVVETFSVNQLFLTLFSPWKRIITQPGRSLEERFRASLDNAFSRVIGFFVRLMVLIAALFSLIVVAIICILEIVLWPLLPLSVPGFIVAGILK